MTAQPPIAEPQGQRRDAPAWTKLEMIFDPGERERFKADAHGRVGSCASGHLAMQDLPGRSECRATNALIA